VHLVGFIIRMFHFVIQKQKKICNIKTIPLPVGFVWVNSSVTVGAGREFTNFAFSARSPERQYVLYLSLTFSDWDYIYVGEDSGK